MSASLGKNASSGSSTSSGSMTPVLSQEQKDMLKAQTNLFTSTIAPSYQNAVTGATDLYNQIAPGAAAAAQNYGAIAGQAQDVLGSTGQSALQTGIAGLENIFSDDYKAQQINNALQPAQAQYQQNLTNQGMQYGGAGQIGSARQALAQTQLAQGNQAIQASLAAQVGNQIAGQQLQAGTVLGQLGQAGLTGAQAAGANQLAAAGAPQSLYNQYASILFGTPSSSWNPSFAGTQGQTTTGGTSQSQQSMSAMGGFNLSDIRLKQDVKFLRSQGGHKIYSFKYIVGDDNTYEGVMAQDVLEYNPDAVSKGINGFYRVNYSALGLEMKVIQ